MASLFVQRLLQNQSPQDDEELRRQAMIASQGMRGELGDAPPNTARGPVAGDAPNLPTNNAPVASVPQVAQNPITPERAAMTRPRTVAPQPEMSNPDATRTRFNDPVRLTESGRPELRPYDYGANPLDSAVAFENAANSAEIHGHGFKNRMKSGLLNALSAAPQERAAAFVQGVAAPNLIRKKLTQADATQNLGQQLGIARERAQVAQMGLSQVQVPQYGPNGEYQGSVSANVPQKDVGRLLQGNARTNISGAQQSERRRRNDAYVGHLNDLPAEKRSEAARKIWLSGVADGNDELKADLAKRMGITEELPDSDKGSLQTDNKGNFTVIHTRQGTAAPILNESTNQPIGSFQQTQLEYRKLADQRREAGLDRRSGAQIAAQERRTGAVIQAQTDRAREAAVQRIYAMGDPNELYGSAASLMDQASHMPDNTARDQVMAAARKIYEKAQASDSAHKHAPAQGGAPQATSPTPVKLTTKGFTERFQKKRGRAPSAAEIAAFEAEHPQ